MSRLILNGSELAEKQYVDDSIANIDLSIKQDVIQYTTMPEPTEDLVGKTVQYIGEDINDRLPGEYQEVEYIQNTSSSYIDTGLDMSNGGKIEIRFEPTDLPYTYNNIYGCQIGEEPWKSICARANGTSFEVYAYETGYFNTIENSEVYTLEHAFKNNISTVSLNGEIPVSNEGSVELNSYNLYLFANNEAGNAVGNGYYKIYYCKIYNENDELIRDFVPCYRKSDNVIGLYDLIGDIFYTNAGSGTFTKGSDIATTSFKNGYWYQVQDGGHNITGLDKVTVNNGVYVPLNIIPTSDYTIRINFNIPYYINDEHIIGTDGGPDAEPATITDPAWYTHFTTYNSSYYWGMNGVEHNGGTFSTGDHEVAFNVGEDNELILDGTVLDTGASSSSYSLNLFRRSNVANFVGDFYRLRIYNKSTGEDIIDLKPAVLNTTGEVVLYDIINDNIYHAEGGSLISGQESGWWSDHLGYIWKEIPVQEKAYYYILDIPDTTHVNDQSVKSVLKAWYLDWKNGTNVDLYLKAPIYADYGHNYGPIYKATRIVYSQVWGPDARIDADFEGAVTNGLILRVCLGFGVNTETDEISVSYYGTSGYSFSGEILTYTKTYGGAYWQREALAIDNSTAFTPTGDYNPATKKYVDDLVGSIDVTIRSIVQELPTTNINPNMIYMVRKSNSNSVEIGEVGSVTPTDSYYEYMYINNQWEIIGDTEIDLSDYLSKDNIIAYTPSGDYNPATKKYVDDLVGDIEAILSTLTIVDEEEY